MNRPHSHARYVSKGYPCSGKIASPTSPLMDDTAEHAGRRRCYARHRALATRGHGMRHQNSWCARWVPSRSQLPSNVMKKTLQLGWVVHWALSIPPGHPATGRCGLVVPAVPPSHLFTRPPRARPSVRVQNHRISSRGAPVTLAGYRTHYFAVCIFISSPE
jgi:hypothetical protein